MTADPEVPIESIETMDQGINSPSVPEEINKNRPEPILDKKGVSQLQLYLHDHIAKPLIGPPDPGHTTFTIELKDQTVTGFHQMSTETKSLKELGPIIKTKVKSLMKNLKDRDFKEDIKNLKKLPTTIKKQVTKINIDSFKTLPKKIRGIFSSD